MADTGGLRERAVEKQSNTDYIATADYFCQIEGCSKFGKKIPKGLSHAHFSWNPPKHELDRRLKIANEQRIRRQRRIWSKQS